jgi:hypothetical protein
LSPNTYSNKDGGTKSIKKDAEFGPILLIYGKDSSWVETSHQPIPLHYKQSPCST